MATKPDIPQYSEDDYDIRPAANNDETMKIWYPFMLDLGWNRGPYDLPTYMDHSKSRGMLLIFRKGSTYPLGHVSAVVNDNATGWVAMFIVDAAYHGKGLGRALWNAMMGDFHRCGTRYVGLDAVPQQKGTYERRGFVESKLGSIHLMTRKLPSALPVEESTHIAGELVEIHKVPHHLLAEHELKYTGLSRPQLWAGLLHRPDVRGYALVTTSPPRTADDVAGWTVVRRCPGGARIGPVYAADEKAARAVLSAAIIAATPEYIRSVPLDGTQMSEWSEGKISSEAHLAAEIWSGNPEALSLFADLGWESLGQYYRMWLDGKAPPAQSDGGLAQKGVFATFDGAIG